MIRIFEAYHSEWRLQLALEARLSIKEGLISMALGLLLVVAGLAIFSLHFAAIRKEFMVCNGCIYLVPFFVTTE